MNPVNPMNPDASSRSEIIAYLSHVDIEESVGFIMENFCDRFYVETDELWVFERFLAAHDLDNRMGALETLVRKGKGSGGYEADLVLFHFQARTDPDVSSVDQWTAINLLGLLSKAGSASALRAWTILFDDPYVKEYYG